MQNNLSIPLMATVLLVGSCGAQVRQEPSAAAPEMNESLRIFLQAFDDDETTRFVAAFSDLNGDGRPEAIVYLVSNRWCGSGGCNTLVLTQDDKSWKILTKITITNPPIRVLDARSNGWRSLGVWVQGGGIQPGYEAEIQFNGKTYPRNPSVPPARKLTTKVVGEVLIPSTKDATALYPAKATDH
jgi:hypothetical protein